MKIIVLRKSVASNGVRVRVPPSVPIFMLKKLKQIWKILFPDPINRIVDPISNLYQYEKLTNVLGALTSTSTPVFASHKINHNMCLNMRLHSASNGMILEVTSTDYTQMNPNTSTLHVLSNENLGEELQKIILVELLKK
jgi:hypothetical protein